MPRHVPFLRVAELLPYSPAAFGDSPKGRVPVRQHNTMLREHQQSTTKTPVFVDASPCFGIITCFSDSDVRQVQAWSPIATDAHTPAPAGGFFCARNRPIKQTPSS